MKNTIKRISVLLLTFILIFSLTGCGEVKKAENAVNEMFASFEAADFEDIKKYFDMSEFDKDDNLILNNAESMIQVLFVNLDYSIVSSEKNNDGSVSVKTNITAADMKPILNEFFMNAMTYALSNALADPLPTEEEVNEKMKELFIESASKPDLATVTNTVDIKVSKSDDNSWIVETDDDLINALFGGLTDAVSDMEQSLNSIGQ